MRIVDKRVHIGRRGFLQAGTTVVPAAALVVSLYNQPAVWAKLGYEGSSAEHGGYIHRGFDDIDWLNQV